MIDNVIYTDFEINYNYTLFYAEPHEIYLNKIDNINKTYYYHYIPADYIHDITNLIHKYEWNKFLIFVDKGETSINIYINFNKAEKINISGISGRLSLNNIVFCSKKTISSPLKYPNCISNRTIRWASAYYNNIRVWNILTSTIDTIQSFINKVYSEYPQSLVLFYPLTI